MFVHFSQCPGNELPRALESVDPCRLIVRDPVPSDQLSGANLGKGLHTEGIWSIVKGAAAKSGLSSLAPHDLLMTCGRLRNQGEFGTDPIPVGS